MIKDRFINFLKLPVRHHSCQLLVCDIEDTLKETIECDTCKPKGTVYPTFTDGIRAICFVFDEESNETWLCRCERRQQSNKKKKKKKKKKNI